jgi:hypothetical protein
VDWLNYNGFTMRTKPAKEYTDSLGRRKVKGNMDVELCVDALELAAHIDHACSSRRRRLQAAGGGAPAQGRARLGLLTIRSQPPMISTTCAARRQLHRPRGPQGGRRAAPRASRAPRAAERRWPARAPRPARRARAPVPAEE